MSPGRDGYFLEDRVEGKGLDLALVRRLLRYVVPHGRLLLLALLGLALGTACQLAGPYIIKIVIDRHVTPRILDGMGGWIALYLLSLTGAMGFLFLEMYAISLVGARVILHLRTELFSRMERLPVSFFDRTPTGRLMTRLSSDVEALQELITSGLVSTAGDAAVLLGIAAILVGMDRPLALTAFAVLPVLLLFVELLKKFIRAANREMRRKLARLNAFLQEHIAGIVVVKAFLGEEKAQARFAALNADYAAENVRLTNYYSVYFPGVELIASVTVAALLWKGGGRLVAGAVTFGTLVAFLEYVQKFFNPIKDMSDKYNILQSALASCERIFHLLDTAESPEYRADGQGWPSAGTGRDASAVVVPADGQGRPSAGTGRDASLLRVPAVEFRDVWFAYPRPDGGDDGRGREDMVLKGVSFAVGDGETAAIVGATGAGKTTILALLCRLYEISRGQILVGGRDIRDIPRRELRGLMSLVLQEPFLFSGTLRENVEAGGGPPESTALSLGATAFAADWPKGLATPVGERGVRLSAGQRQLVALARAVARRPRLLLLDEATSSVDPVTEDLLREGIAGLLAGRTSIVVAHRLSTVLSADRIVVLHRGRVREQGTHAELLAAGGIYRRLYELQFRESRLP